MTNPTPQTDQYEELEELLYRFKMAHSIAFNEIDPHNPEHKGKGISKVFKRSKVIEDEAKQAILALIQDEVRKANNKPVEIAGSLHKGGGVIGSSSGAVTLDYVLDPEDTGTLSFKITYLPIQLSEGKE